MPTSELVAFAPNSFSLAGPGFALLAPPGLIVIGFLLPAKWRQGPLQLGWLQTVIDRRFGEGAALNFWHRLRPLPLISAYTFLLGTSGLVASAVQDAPLNSFEHSITFLCFGIGFFIASMIERHMSKARNAA